MTSFSILINADNNLSYLIDKLKKEHVTTIIVFDVVQPEVRSIISNDESKLPIENTYVLWLDHGNWNILSSHPMNYIPICINASVLKIYFKKYIKTMRNEVIKPSHIYDSDDIIRSINIYFSSVHLKYEFNGNALSAENNPRYYLYNRKLKRISFIRMLIKVIKSSSLDGSLKGGLFPLWE